MPRFLLGALLVLTVPGCAETEPEPAERLAITAVDERIPPAMDELWVADRDGDAIVHLDASGHAEVVADAASVEPGLLARPSSVRRGPDGALYVATFHSSGVTRLAEGEATRFFSDSFLEEPVELCFRGDRLYVLGNDTANVVVANADGGFVDEFGYPQMRSAHDMAFGPDGLLYVATSVSLALEAGLQIWDVDTKELVDVFGPEEEIGRATGIAFGPSGDLFVADGMHGRILRYDVDSRALVQVVVEEGLEQPVSLAVSSEGTIYVADRQGVHRFEAQTGAAIGSVVGGYLDRVRGVTLVE